MLNKKKPSQSVFKDHTELADREFRLGFNPAGTSFIWKLISVYMYTHTQSSTSCCFMGQEFLPTWGLHLRLTAVLSQVYSAPFRPTPHQQQASIPHTHSMIFRGCWWSRANLDMTSQNQSHLHFWSGCHQQGSITWRRRKLQTHAI